MFANFRGRFTNRKWNEFLAALEARLQLRGGPGIFIRSNQNGSTFRAARKNRGGGGAEVPFDVRLITTVPEGGGSPTYEITSGGYGYVNERVTGTGNATPTPHKPANRDDEEADPIVPKKFPITVGQAFYVRVEVGVDGKIVAPEDEEAVKFEVAEDDAQSVHYQPAAGDETPDGVAGHYMYKLAVLKAPVAPSTTPKLEKWLAGSHIDHWSELPKIKNSVDPDPEEGIGTVVQEWRDDENAYRLRAIWKGLGQANIQNDGDFIEVRGTKKDGQVDVYVGDAKNSDPLAKWSDGYWTNGQDVVGDEEPAVEINPSTLFIPTVVDRSFEEESGIDPQVHVRNVGTNGDVYLVEGNSINGDLEYQIGEESAEKFAVVKDGLISEIIKPVPIPQEGSGGGETLHQWKVTKSGSLTVDVAAGTIFTNNDFTGTTVLDPGTSLAKKDLPTPATGHVILTINRNSDSRAFESAAITFVAGAPESSDYSAQIIPLASVTVAAGEIEEIIQLEFRELRICEMLIVAQGEFRFADAMIASRNIYELPPA